MNKKLPCIFKAYGYPEIVLEVVSKFSERVLEVFQDARVGILLVGSTSRGELCWSTINNNVVLYSDIEFMIAVDSNNLRKKQELSKKIKELSDAYNLGKRFHFDYVINEWSNFKYLEKKIFIFDSKNTGIYLTEKKIIEYLPDVKKENLDFNELNDVLLHRVKAILKDMPIDSIKANVCDLDFVLSIAKNTLDITTWLHPYEADTLLSGFERRLIFWGDNFPKMKLAHYFNKEDIDFLHECLNIRRSPQQNYNTLTLLKNCVRIYKKAIEYSKEMNSIDSINTIDACLVSKKMFHEYKILRRFLEAYKIMRHYKIFTISTIVSNIFFPRKGKQITFCFTMIESILVSRNDSRKTNYYVTKAKHELRSLRKINDCNNDDFFGKWECLRNQYLALTKVFI